MAQGTTTYYLWLDESGDFEEDSAQKRSGPSLVGGVCCEESIRRGLSPANILDRVSNNPQFRAAFREAGYSAVNHAVELPNSIKTAARAIVVQACAERGMEFIFFQNRSKIRVIDNTTTYLNFLAEGLAQFMAHLSVRGPAHLNVVIGRRLDVTAYEKSGGAAENARKTYIPAEAYLERINERIALARARYLFDGANEVTHSVSFDNDKTNSFLILSDYVCSCKFTLNSADTRTRMSYEEKMENGLTCRQTVERLFAERGMVFGLMEDRLHHDVRRSLSNRHWGGALYLALSRGTPDRSLRQELLDSFGKLDTHGQKTQMEVFFQLVNHLMRVSSSYEAVVLLLETYLEHLPLLAFSHPEMEAYCQVNAWLYLSAAHTHSGKTLQASRLLHSCEALLPTLLRYPENRALYYMVRNREAVICQDCFQFERTLEHLDEALCVAELEQENLRQLCSVLNHPIGDSPSEQQAKLLGSRALTCQYMLPTHPELAEEARQTARQAIEAFAYPEDKRRHQMTLAEIELRCGDLAAAQSAFAEGLGCRGEALLSTLEECSSPFDWYHAIRLADGLWTGDETQKALARDIFQLIRTHFDQVFKNAHPAHSAARRAGLLCLKMGESKGFARRCFSKCEELCFQRDNLSGALWVVGLAYLADRILLALGSNDPAGNALEEKFAQRLAEAERAELPEEMTLFYQSLHCRPEEIRRLEHQKKMAYYQSFSDQVSI